MTTTQSAIYDLLVQHWPGRSTATTISHATRLHPSTIRRNLWIMHGRGHAVNTRIHGEAWWVLTKRGERHARAELTARYRATRTVKAPA